MGFIEWCQNRKAGFWGRVGEKYRAREDFRHVADNTYEFKGETFELVMPTDDDWTAFVYIVVYRKWCAKHGQEPGPFEFPGEDDATADLEDK